MYQIKKINLDHLPIIENMIPNTTQRVGFGGDKVSKEDYLKYTERLLASNSHTTWGLFDNDEFISYMTSFDFPNLPYHGIINFKVLKNFNLYDTTINGYDHLMDYIAELKEKEHRYSFFTARAARSPKLRTKIANSTVNVRQEFWTKYIMTIEEHVPAGQPSQFEYFNKALFRDKVFTNDFLVFKFTCRNKFRSFKTLNGDELVLKTDVDSL
jgi:hypothetical protein